MTLDFEYTNSKLLDVVSVADVDAEESVDDILVKILKLRFVEIWNLNFNHEIEAEVLSRFSSISLVKSLRLRFSHIFEAEVRSKILKLNFGQDSKAEVR